MKSLKSLVILLLAVFLFSSLSPAVAGQKNDGDPDGGTLKYGEYGGSSTLDPVTSNDMVALRVSELIFNGLVGINERQEVVPELAERWEVSDDGAPIPST
jgi:peptide/nickel transport system substrate-binding protein